MFDSFNKAINDQMTTEEVREIIENDKKRFLEEINAYADLIKEGNDKNQIIKDINEQCKKGLASFIIGTLSRNLRPFEETRFIRELDNDSFTAKSLFIIDNTMLVQESVDNINSGVMLNEEEVDIYLTMLNTVCNWIIIKRHSYSRFLQEAKEMFRFSDEKIRILWDILNEKKQDIKETLILDSISLTRDIRRDMDRLLGMFARIADSEH